MYFDDVNEKKAQRLEKQLDKQIVKLETQADKLVEKGNSTGELCERADELRNSLQDIKNMRNNKDTEFRYAKASSKNNTAGKGNPATLPTGTNDGGHNVVTMFIDGSVGNKIHESRHGGQVARGEYSFDQNKNPTAGYNIDSEVSAYRAQYAYNGSLSYRQSDYLRNNPTVADAFRQLGASVIPIVTISNINSINSPFVRNIGEEGRFNSRRTWLPLYQRITK